MHLAMLLLSATLTVARVEKPSYVLVTPNDTSTYGSFTLDEIEMIRDVYGPRVFFFRSNARAYVVFDEKVIAYVEDLFRPQRELGQRQAQLGRPHARLGDQSELSREMGRKLSTLTDEWIRSGVAKPLQR